jgi:flagellar basal-body rod modification protein FlgD
MSVDGVNNTTTAYTSQPQTSAATLAKDFQTFLSLLTTQLKYQDPLEPLDSNQFTEQLVSFTGVEQQIATNKNLEAILTRLTSQDISNSVSYIGKEIYALADKAALIDGEAGWTYTLELKAEETTITVRDAKGVVVYEGPGETEAGTHSFTWDGITMNGAEAPEGVYSLEVKAVSSSGQDIASNIFIRGIVKGIERVGGENYLSVNGVLLPAENVQSINQPGVRNPEVIDETT